MRNQLFFFILSFACMRKKLEFVGKLCPHYCFFMLCFIYLWARQLVSYLVQFFNDRENVSFRTEIPQKTLFIGIEYT